MRLALARESPSPLRLQVQVRISVGFSLTTSLQGRLPCGRIGVPWLSGSSKLCAVHPLPMHDDGQFPREGDFGALCATSSGNAHHPCLERDPPVGSHQHHMRRFIKRSPHTGIASLGDRRDAIRFAGLISSWRQAKMARPHPARVATAFLVRPVGATPIAGSEECHIALRQRSPLHLPQACPPPPAPSRCPTIGGDPTHKSQLPVIGETNL